MEKKGKDKGDRRRGNGEDKRSRRGGKRIKEVGEERRG